MTDDKLDVSFLYAFTGLILVLGTALLFYVGASVRPDNKFFKQGTIVEHHFYGDVIVDWSDSNGKCGITLKNGTRKHIECVGLGVSK